MTNTQNSSRETERKDSYKIRSILWGLATDIAPQRCGAEFTVLDRNGWGDDPAKYIQLVQIGPERGFLFRKRKPLLAIRGSDYSDFKTDQYAKSHNCPVQITCFDADIEEMATKAFNQLAQQLEVPGGVSVDRFCYSK